MRILFFVFCVAFVAAPPAQARDLDDVQSELSVRKDEQAQLEKDRRDAAEELAAIKKEMIKTAAAVRESEAALKILDDRIAVMGAEETELSTRLEGEYGSIGKLILALERLRRVPPEALIVRPGAPLQTAQSAMLLHSILPAVKKQADDVAANIARLQTLGAELADDRKAAAARKEELAKKYDEIAGLSKKREKLYRTLDSQYAETADEIEALAREATSMQDLMVRLTREKERKDREPPSSSSSPRSYAWSMPREGKPQLPVGGAISTGFGEKDAIGARSDGLTIISPPGALAVAPMGGIVRFAGPFKNYNHLVIIEHPKGYYSLIGGMDQISARTGQRIDAGEPVGKLPMTSSRPGGPALYYELRYKGRPVDPSDKFPNIKS